MILLLLAGYITWAAGVLTIGENYFQPRNIEPFDQYGLPALVVTVWPVGFPVYLIGKWLLTR